MVCAFTDPQLNTGQIGWDWDDAVRLEHVHICYGLSVLHLTDISRFHRGKKKLSEEPHKGLHEYIYIYVCVYSVLLYFPVE